MTNLSRRRRTNFCEKFSQLYRQKIFWQTSFLIDQIWYFKIENLPSSYFEKLSRIVNVRRFSPRFWHLSSAFSCRESQWQISLFAHFIDVSNDSLKNYKLLLLLNMTLEQRFLFLIETNCCDIAPVFRVCLLYLLFGDWRRRACLRKLSAGRVFNQHFL